MSKHKTFVYRLEPSVEQRQLFARFAGCSRFVFNQALAARKAHYQACGKTLSYFDQCKMLAVLKKAHETAWLSETHSQTLQQALQDLDWAFQQFFRRLKRGETPGFPKFKKKGKRDSFRYSQSVKVRPGEVFLPKIGWVAYRDSRPVEGKILQATVKRHGEHWFVHLVSKIDAPSPTPATISAARAVGIDVGLKCFAFLSSGTSVENPRFLRAALTKLARGQRRLSRMTQFSHNWKRQAAKVARLHTKVKNSRRDFAHKTSTSIVKNHDVIVVEDLNIRGMLKNCRLSRAIADASWGQFLYMLEYKSAWAGKHFIRIGRFEPTSQKCSTCEERKPMPLSARTFSCDNCDTVIDRDWNASLNIRAAGLSALNACGGA